MAWLFLIVVCGIIALLRFDLHLYKEAEKLYFFGGTIQARKHLFKIYVKNAWALCKRLLVGIKNSFTIVFAYTLFGLFFIVFGWFFWWYLLPFISSLYELIGYQVNNIKVGDDGFRNVSLSIAGSITLSIAVLGVILTLIRNILTRQQNNISEQVQITESMGQAIAQIGAFNGEKPNIEVRMGGLYSLQRIMKYSPKDKESIARILYAYVHENTKRDKTGQPKKKNPAMHESYRMPEDIQAALNIISQFNKEQRKEGRDNFLDSQLNLSHTDFSSYSFINMDFSHAVLEYVDLSNADLSHTNLSNANLLEANLHGIGSYELNLSSANLWGANLSKAVLTDADVTNATFIVADFSGADLYCVDFFGANLVGANFSKAILRNTFLSGVDLTKVRNLTQEQIDSAVGDAKTKLPEGLIHPESWKKD